MRGNAQEAQDWQGVVSVIDAALLVSWDQVFVCRVVGTRSSCLV